MTWNTSGDLDEFVAVVSGFLRTQPAQNTILLTTVDHLRIRGLRSYGEAEPLFGWWCEDGGVSGAFLQTPPHPLLLTDVPEEALAPLVTILAGVDQINAQRSVAEAVATEWLRQSGVATHVRRHIRLYRLEQLTPPDPAPSGRARMAEAADRELLLAWYAAFMTELDEVSHDLAMVVDDRISYGGLALWECDGVPVSMAGRTRPMAGTVRVAPVFTPADLRGRGYASAVTAAISRAAREVAGEVLLFTDVANAASNAIYQRLGYRPVEDRLVLSRQAQNVVTSR